VAEAKPGGQPIGPTGLIGLTGLTDPIGPTDPIGLTGTAISATGPAGQVRIAGHALPPRAGRVRTAPLGMSGQRPGNGPERSRRAAAAATHRTAADERAPAGPQWTETATNRAARAGTATEANSHAPAAPPKTTADGSHRAAATMTTTDTELTVTELLNLLSPLTVTELLNRQLMPTRPITETDHLAASWILLRETLLANGLVDRVPRRSGRHDVQGQRLPVVQIPAAVADR
jgi:hypothetical protein